MLVAMAIPMALFMGPAPRPGSAIVVFLAVAPVVPLLRGAPVAWSAPAAAPLLGLVALAGAFPALAGRLSRVHHRAALGLLGAWWLVLAEPLTERTLLFGAETPRRDAFEGATSVTAGDVVATVVSSGALLAGLIWAAGAAVLPWLVRHRSLTLDIVAATAWSAGLAAATISLGEWLGTPPHGAVFGAIAGALVAVWPSGRE
jgi:hypothetical protein